MPDASLIDLLTGNSAETLLAIAVLYFARESMKKDKKIEDLNRAERDRLVADLKLYQELVSKAEE